MSEKVTKRDRLVVEEVRDWECDGCGRMAPHSPEQRRGLDWEAEHVDLTGWAGMATRNKERIARIVEETRLDFCPDCDATVRQFVASLRKNQPR